MARDQALSLPVLQFQQKEKDWDFEGDQGKHLAFKQKNFLESWPGRSSEHTEGVG